jgi:hypothetical protein
METAKTANCSPEIFGQLGNLRHDRPVFKGKPIALKRVVRLSE